MQMTHCNSCVYTACVGDCVQVRTQCDGCVETSCTGDVPSVQLKEVTTHCNGHVTVHVWLKFPSLQMCLRYTLLCVNNRHRSHLGDLQYSCYVGTILLLL